MRRNCLKDGAPWPGGGKGGRGGNGRRSSFSGVDPGFFASAFAPGRPLLQIAFPQIQRWQGKQVHCRREDASAEQGDCHQWAYRDPQDRSEHMGLKIESSMTHKANRTQSEGRTAVLTDYVGCFPVESWPGGMRPTARLCKSNAQPRRLSTPSSTITAMPSSRVMHFQKITGFFSTSGVPWLFKKSGWGCRRSCTNSESTS